MRFIISLPGTVRWRLARSCQTDARGRRDTRKRLARSCHPRRSRAIAAYQQLGVPKALGLTAKDWVQKRLGGYVKMAAMERYDAAVES